MLILIGPGIHMLVEVLEGATTGTEINLSNATIQSGRFKLTMKGVQTWGTSRTRYPYFTYERIGDIPQGEKSTPHYVLNI